MRFRLGSGLRSWPTAARSGGIGSCSLPARSRSSSRFPAAICRRCTTCARWPAAGLAQRAEIAVEGGIIADEYLETSRPGIFAAGDAVRWPDPRTGGRIRVEHWVVAERQGQVAARNMLGRAERFDAVPFFWSQHYDAAIAYVGYAPAWDQVDVRGSLAARDATVIYRRAGQVLAVATVFRDGVSLAAEAAMERGDAA